MVSIFRTFRGRQPYNFAQVTSKDGSFKKGFVVKFLPGISGFPLYLMMGLLVQALDADSSGFPPGMECVEKK